MPEELANISWGHAHLAHPGGRGGTRTMRGNPSNHIRLADAGEGAEQRNRVFVEEMLSHHLIAILEEIVRGLAGFAILSRFLVGRAHAS